MSTTFRHPKNLKEHGNGKVFERAKSVCSIVFVGYAKLGLTNHWHVMTNLEIVIMCS